MSDDECKTFGDFIRAVEKLVVLKHGQINPHTTIMDLFIQGARLRKSESNTDKECVR